jgi:hypothetical protein
LIKIKVNETFIFEEKSFFSFSRLWKKKITVLNVNEYTKIYDIKKIILKKYNLDDNTDLFKIIYKNKELNDKDSLNEIGIKDNETLMIFCKNKVKLEEILREKNIL